jgi:hypothetical protein
LKILNKAGTHFMQKNKHGVTAARYDTVKNVNEIINSILENGNSKLDGRGKLKPLDGGELNEKTTY